MNLNEEWLNFNTNDDIIEHKEENEKNDIDIGKGFSDIYISTKTKIAYLNLKEIDLYNVFWKINILPYHLPKEGIVKKSIKINCNNEEETKQLDNIISNEKNINVTQMVSVNVITKKIKKYKDVRKIEIGFSKKDIFRYKIKKKGAFYNCFALLLRLKYRNKFKEVHIKIFNTGKLEIPGIQYDDLLIIALNKLCDYLSQIIVSNEKISYSKDSIQNVLINSNFNCGFYINRNKLIKLLKYKYNIQALYDPCSYPGIQCKFYYLSDKKEQDGICNCCINVNNKNKKCYDLTKKEKSYKKCTIISFMIFRTGSVLIVGHCDEDILNIVYKFLKIILTIEYKNIYQNSENIQDVKVKQKDIKPRKKKILISI